MLVEVNLKGHAADNRGGGEEGPRVREDAVDHDEAEDAGVGQGVIGHETGHLEGDESAEGPAWNASPASAQIQYHESTKMQMLNLSARSRGPGEKGIDKKKRTSNEDGPPLNDLLDRVQILRCHLRYSAFPLLAGLNARVLNPVDGAVERLEQEVVEDGAAAIMKEEERCALRAGGAGVDDGTAAAAAAAGGVVGVAHG